MYILEGQGKEMRIKVDLKDLKDLSTYEKVYSYVGKGQRSKAELSEYLKSNENGLSQGTVKTYIKKAFDGELPMLLAQDDKVSVDITALRNYIEELCRYLGTDAAILFTGPAPLPKGKKDKEEMIPQIDGMESPVVKDLKKKNADLQKKLNKKKEELSATVVKKDEAFAEMVAEKDAEISRLQNQNEKNAADEVITRMDKKVVVITDMEVKPDSTFNEDFFRTNPRTQIDIPKLVSKYGGDRESFYKVSGNGKELSVSEYIKQVGTALLKGDFFKRRLGDESYLHRKEISEMEISTNRLQSIQMLLDDEDMSNQMKLAMYAGWHEYRGTEMEDLLNFAGDNGIEANYVIGLLERPTEFSNYQNVRGFLRQACKASEARIKRQAAKELISGEWYVVADYCGKPCRFQMMPVDELISFRDKLMKSQTIEALAELEKLIMGMRKAYFEENNPDKKIIVTYNTVRITDDEYYKNATTMIHQMEAGVDVHVAVDDEVILEDFADKEVADGK